MGKEEDIKNLVLENRLEAILSKYSYEEINSIKSEEIVDLYIKKIDLN